MNGIKITTLCIAIASVVGVANAETCIKTTFNVTYGCNGGTVSGTLPSSTTATYGTSFSPTAITESMCTPPSGYAYGGQAIIIDGETVAYYSSTSGGSFTYYYTTDIEIGPHWVPIAEPATMIANIYDGGRTYTYTNAASGTWTAYFWYGAVSGVSKCTTIKPENTASGGDSCLIATDQSAIENATADGQYCYCKMTEPYIAASPWVFNGELMNASYCASNCASYCGYGVHFDYVIGRKYRASVFAGAMAE
ncbi:MAG: hypothetical protein E7011_04460 [Alphaproteobacteria bacterium]|nr:hypothetical protein [Alphaproteobacteria bacterium]